jgi:hypothetical protein
VEVIVEVVNLELEEVILALLEVLVLSDDEDEVDVRIVVDDVLELVVILNAEL